MYDNQDVSRREEGECFSRGEKANEGVDWEAMWDVLKICRVDGELIDGVKALSRHTSAHVKVKGVKVLEYMGMCSKDV